MRKFIAVLVLCLPLGFLTACEEQEPAGTPLEDEAALQEENAFEEEEATLGEEEGVFEDEETAFGEEESPGEEEGTLEQGALEEE